MFAATGLTGIFAKSHLNSPVSGHGAGYLDLALPISITCNGHVYGEADLCPEAERGFRLGEFLDQEEAT